METSPGIEEAGDILNDQKNELIALHTIWRHMLEIGVVNCCSFNDILDLLTRSHSMAEEASLRNGILPARGSAGAHRKLRSKASCINCFFLCTTDGTLLLYSIVKMHRKRVEYGHIYYTSVRICEEDEVAQ